MRENTYHISPQFRNTDFSLTGVGAMILRSVLAVLNKLILNVKVKIILKYQLNTNCTHKNIGKIL